MVKKTDDGYTLQRVNGDTVLLSKQEAYEVMEAVERSYYKEDIINYLGDNYLATDRITEEAVDEICDLYADAREDDDSWYAILDYVVRDYLGCHKEDEEEN